MKILIVDDVAANTYLLRVLLEHAKYEVIEACNGQVALEVMKSNTVDLVISDILMPEMDGFELCKIWKKDERLKKTPFIFYTATYTEEKDREFSLNLGADLFLVKPMENYNLLREIKKVLTAPKPTSLGTTTHQKNMDNAEYYEKYSSRLVQKLEGKLLQLEQKNSELLRRDSRLIALNDALNFQLSKAQLNQDSLKAHETELLNIVYSMVEGVLTTDHKGIIHEFNPAAEEMLGYSREEVVGKSIDLFMPKSYITTHQDGMTDFVEKGAERLVARDMKANTKQSVEIAIRLSVARLPPDDFNRQLFICTFLDVSKEKQQEEIIAKSRKMEVIGNLSSGIAHDYNNMLSVIMGYSNLLLREDINQKERLEFANQISQAAERGASLTRKLLSMSQNRPNTQGIVNINAVISNNINMLKKLLMQRIDLVVKLEDDAPNVLINENDFEDCLLNMCINSMHAISGSGHITITTSAVLLKNNNEINLPAGKYLKLVVEDDGCGMSAEVSERVFEPFFTTKGQEGTGLGLSQAYGFVKHSKGNLSVYTEEGLGTRFEFYLPESRDKTQLAASKDTGPDKIIADRKKTIMLVDDEPALLKLTEKILKAYGYQVLIANNAQECIDKLEEVKVDLLITDVIMPNMDGIELSELMKNRHPDIKIILMSGYTDKGNKYHLQKPFTSVQLATAAEQAFSVT